MRAKILLVDDDDLLRDIISIALEDVETVELRLAESGEEAVALLSTSSWCPNLVLLDMHMPGMNGLETLAALLLLPTTAETCFAMMSATLDMEIEDLRPYGVSHIIQKPFSFDTIEETILGLLIPPRQTDRS